MTRAGDPRRLAFGRSDQVGEFTEGEPSGGGLHGARGLLAGLEDRLVDGGCDEVFEQLGVLIGQEFWIDADGLELESAVDARGDRAAAGHAFDLDLAEGFDRLIQGFTDLAGVSQQFGEITEILEHGSASCLGRGRACRVGFVFGLNMDGPGIEKLNEVLDKRVGIEVFVFRNLHRGGNWRLGRW